MFPYHLIIFLLPDILTTTKNTKGAIMEKINKKIKAIMLAKAKEDSRTTKKKNSEMLCL